MMPSNFTVFVNREGGAAAAAGERLPETIAGAFLEAGVEVRVQMLAGNEMASAIRAATKTMSRIIVAGGDGTAACAASIVMDSDIELALLPLGTLNHLARDIGIPADLGAAAALAAKGRSITVDVGEVNGQRFVNNASIGLYPSMVRQRDALRGSHGMPKWLATMPASLNVLSRFRHHRLRIDMGEGEQPMLTPLLFVGNNRYSLDAGSIGSRTSLQDGSLSVYAVARRSRTALIWFAMRALVGRIDRAKDFLALGDCAAITVRAPGGPIEIALDGEVRRLTAPLEFRIVPGALRIVAPEPSEGSFT